MFDSKIFTVTSILTLVVLLATIVIQLLEMRWYEMF